MFAAGFAHITPTNGGPAPVEAGLLYLLAVLCFLVFALYIWWLLRASVIANPEGLHERKLGGWKSVRWDEVTDYYESLPLVPPRRSTQSQSKKVQPSKRVQPTVVLSILTATRRIGVTSRSSKADALRELVAANAINSRAESWEIYGTRLFDPWPRVFDYDTQRNYWAPRLWLKLFVTFVIYIFVEPALQLTATANLIGWTTTLATAGLYLLLVGSIGLIFLFPLANYRAANRRRAERISVDLTGISFEDGTRRLEADWPDVTGYGAAFSPSISNRYFVETRSGEFDFLSSLGNAALLQEIIRRYATASADRAWKLRGSGEMLGGEASRWSGGKVGIGARVYHYRTRTHRALLGLPLMLCLVFELLAWMTWQGLLPGQSVRGQVLIGAVSGLGFLCSYFAYRHCRIECDEEGMTQISLWSRHRLRWERVEDYYLTKERGGVVLGQRRRLQFSADIAGREELKTEITQRVINCGGKQWELLSTPTAPDAG